MKQSCLPVHSGRKRQAEITRGKTGKTTEKKEERASIPFDGHAMALCERALDLFRPEPLSDR